MRPQTMFIKNENGPVLINVEDFNPETMTVFEGDPFAQQTETAIPANTTEPTEQKQPETVTEPQTGAPANSGEPAAQVQRFVAKKGRKFIVVDAAGAAIDGFEEFGAEADAWAAIVAAAQTA